MPCGAASLVLPASSPCLGAAVGGTLGELVPYRVRRGAHAATAWSWRRRRAVAVARLFSKWSGPWVPRRDSADAARPGPCGVSQLARWQPWQTSYRYLRTTRMVRSFPSAAMGMTTLVSWLTARVASAGSRNSHLSLLRLTFRRRADGGCVSCLNAPTECGLVHGLRLLTVFSSGNCWGSPGRRTSCVAMDAENLFSRQNRPASSTRSSRVGRSVPAWQLRRPRQ